MTQWNHLIFRSTWNDTMCTSAAGGVGDAMVLRRCRWSLSFRKSATHRIRCRAVEEFYAYRELNI